MHPDVEEAVSVIEQSAQEDGTGLLFTGGKDSMIILYLWREYAQISNQPPLLVVDTYNQFDEIYDFRDQISEDWDLQFDVRANKQFLENVIWNEDDERDFAWDGFKTDACCQALKIDVMEDFIADGYDPLLVGRRAEDVGGELDTRVRKEKPLPHVRYHPLANWSDELLQMFIDREGIPLPELYYEGYNHTDCTDCTVKGEDDDDWSDMDAEQRQQLNQLRDMGYM